MTRLKDNRRPAVTLRTRFLFTKGTAALIALLVAARLLWAAHKHGESQAFLDSVQAAWAGSAHLLVLTALALAGAAGLLGQRLLPIPARPVWLVDTACWIGPDELKSPHEGFIDQGRKRGVWGEESLAFMDRLLKSSGLGDETYLPETIVKEPMNLTWGGSLKEAELVLFDATERLFQQTGFKPEDVDILIVCCSCFAPTPSLASMIVNRFKLRTDCLTHNLAGMGCSAGVIGIDLARMCLQAQPNARALLVCTEIMTANSYQGNNRSCLVSNCLFRMGCAASLLSNHPADKRRAKYELKRVVRSHLGADDVVFGAIRQLDDEEGIRGIHLEKGVVVAAGLALRTNIAALAPWVLPLSELVKCAMDKAYTPDFKKAFDHFLVHTGGRAVIEEVEKRLELTPEQVAPSKATLRRFGNTCCAAVFYVMTNVEATTGVKKGDRLWMLGFGTGFKCNSACWVAMRSFKQEHECWK